MSFSVYLINNITVSLYLNLTVGLAGVRVLHTNKYYLSDSLHTTEVGDSKSSFCITRPNDFQDGGKE